MRTHPGPRVVFAGICIATVLASAPTQQTEAQVQTPSLQAPPPNQPTQPTPTPPQPQPHFTLSEQIDLPRLVDLASQRLKVNIEYDPAALKGGMTLRLGAGVTDTELWELTNRLLAARGFTTVRLPGDNVLSIVKVEAAPGLTRIEEPGQAPLAPGFTAVVHRLKNRAAKEVLEPLKLLVSKPGGSVSVLGEDLILLMDLTPRVEQTLAVLDRLDSSADLASVVEVPAVNLSAAQLTAIVLQVAAKRDAVSGSKMAGEVIAAPDGASVLLIAPQSRVEYWKDLLARLDKREPVETATYSPRYFALQEVAKIVEQAARQGAGAGPGGGGDDRLRIVVNDLTGSLIVTGTPSQQVIVRELIERLNAVPPEGRRPMRVFKVRNRGVNDVLTVLQDLVNVGAVETLSEEPRADQGAAAANAPIANGAIGAGRAPDSGAAPEAAPANTPTAPRSVTTAPSPTQQMYPERTRSQGPGSRRQGTTGSHASNTSKGAESGLLLTADEGTNSIIAVGDARLLTQIESLIAALDVRRPQVMVEALVISLSDADAINLGVEIEKQLNLTDAVMGRLSSLFGLSTRGANGDREAADATGFTGLVLNPGDFSVVIHALEQLNHGRSLSTPRILVNSNQSAVFNSVLQQPLLATNASSTVATTSYGGTSDAGTSVTVKPQIAEGDHLVLEYRIELSSFVGSSSTPGLPPPRQTNNVSSNVTLPDGFTVVVGGLELTSETNATSQVPFIGSIPIIGEAFKNRANSVSHSRFFVFIRASVQRHAEFEDLKYLSTIDTRAAGIDDGWPELEPRVIR